jgi:hypothetical protein
MTPEGTGSAGHPADVFHQLLADRAQKLAGENVELLAEVQRLQRALHFWLPTVPADDPEIAERVSHDIDLLIGFDPRNPVELDAEARGWTRLRHPPQSEKQDV